MYLTHLVIKSIGPIDELFIEMPFYEDGKPKPVIFVGENGTGKSMLQSQLIDSFYEFGGALFDDVGIKKDLQRYYYKLSGGTSLQVGKDKGFSLLRFIDKEQNKIEYFDKIGEVSKTDFERFLPDFSLSPNSEKGGQKLSSPESYNSDQKKKLKKEWIAGVHFHQPAYRFEEPFWKNEPYNEPQRFEEKSRLIGHLDKKLEMVSSTKENKAYLMDLVLDFTNNPSQILDRLTWQNINDILRKIKQRDDIRFGIGPRGGYRVAIGIINQNDQWQRNLIPSIDNLSLGESLLLNLFINILRYGDTPPKRKEEIEGVVAIDEIDVHLHTDLQTLVLPNLIQMFPKIQFIITTHSPLFLLGMQRVFGEDGFEVRNMPSGTRITTERFSEFDAAYKVLKDTEKFEKEISDEIKQSTKPVVFVEGDYDIRYISRAAELLGKTELLNRVQFQDGDGFGNLDKVWKSFDSKLSEIIPQNLLLLYDCDTNKQSAEKGKVFKRVIPTTGGNPVKKGIENLLPDSIIQSARRYNSAFIDFTPQVPRIIRGVEETNPEKFEVNKDEKRNLCTWVCENATPDEFSGFEQIFTIMEGTILRT